MSLIDEYMQHQTAKLTKSRCVDEVAKDSHETPSVFREEARKSLFMAGKKTPDEIDQAFMNAVKDKMEKEEGPDEAKKRLDFFKSEKNCY